MINGEILIFFSPPIVLLFSGERSDFYLGVLGKIDACLVFFFIIFIAKLIIFVVEVRIDPLLADELL